MNRMLISAAHKSSGKTMVSIGLCAALSARGHSVQPFKKGPDYIDPMWLSLASGNRIANRTCRNLDLYLMERDDIVATFARHSAEVSLVEGNKGLYDGLALDGSNSNAALAKLLDLPVFLVIDARGMTRGIAPLILGYQAFDRDIHIAGVILNNLGGSRHEAKLREVIDHYTDVPVIGAIQHDERLSIVERHLGLMPSNESHVATSKIKQIGDAIAEQVDLDKLLALSRKAPLGVPQGSPIPNPLPQAGEGANAKNILQFPAMVSPLPIGEKVRVGIARDRAFGFYYADDLDALEAAGAELVPFDTLRDVRLPEVGCAVYRRRFSGDLRRGTGGQRRAARADQTGHRKRHARLCRMRRFDVPVTQHRLSGAHVPDGRRDPRRCAHARQANRTRLCPSERRGGASLAAPHASFGEITSCSTFPREKSPSPTLHCITPYPTFPRKREKGQTRKAMFSPRGRERT